MAEQPYKEIVSGDHKYQVYTITGRQACHLDRKVTDLAYQFRNVAHNNSTKSCRRPWWKWSGSVTRASRT